MTLSFEHNAAGERTEDEAVLYTGNKVGELQEICMVAGLGQPDYHDLETTGPAHRRVFTVECRVGGAARAGTARTKKEARRQAAGALLELDIPGLQCGSDLLATQLNMIDINSETSELGCAPQERSLDTVVIPAKGTEGPTYRPDTVLPGGVTPHGDKAKFSYNTDENKVYQDNVVQQSHRQTRSQTLQESL